MPTSVYVRTPAMMKKIRKNFKKGHSPKARRKAIKSIKKVWEDPEKRKAVSDYNRKAMWRPEVRKKHMKGLKKAFRENGSNFKGGNGQTPVGIVLSKIDAMAEIGFIHEYVVRTKGHNTKYNPPPHYKVDFGNPDLKEAIEFDGPCHRPFAKQKKDRKKTKVLKALGWKIYRVKHK
jgi:hypothetical protein